MKSIRIIMKTNFLKIKKALVLVMIILILGSAGVSAQNTSYEVNVTPNMAEGGFILGAGIYQQGTICTLTAQADNSSYSFLNWTENDEVLSTDNPYSFTVDADRNIVANFLEKHYVTDYNQYPGNMIPLSVVFIDGVEQTSPSLEVGAFCGDESRGSEIPIHIDIDELSIDSWMCFLTIQGQYGENITFRLYDHSIRQELELQCVTELEWDEDAGYAYDFYAPLEIHFISNTVVTQTIELQEGWNWFSTYIMVDDSEAMLLNVEEGLGENGLQIKSMDDYTTYEDGEWGAMGDLEEMYNEQMYAIEVSADCTVTLQGALATPENYTIEINPGWNWIGFPCNEVVSIEEALANFDAEDGDQIKGAEEFSTYEDGEWGAMGDLEELVPGQGYKYFSASSEVKELVFSLSISRKSIIRTDKVNQN